MKPNLEETTTIMLSNEITKMSNQDEQEGLSLIFMGKKESRKVKSEFVEGMSLLSPGRSLKEELQASIRVIEEKKGKLRRQT